MSTRYRTTYHGILLGLLLHVIMAQAVNAQRSLSERLDYFRSLGERTELELEEIRTPIVSYQALMDSITQRILTEQCSYIVYPAELGNAFTFVINPDANQAILRLGYLQSPSSLLPDHVEQCAYTPWLFGNELLTASKNKANADPLFRFFDAMPGPVKVTQALWYYFNKREPERILPPPTVENMYFFKGKTGDMDNMQSLLNSDKQGYIICPVWTEDVTGVLDNPDENPSIRGSGTIEFFIKEAPLSIALNITPWEEDAIGYRETDFIPFVYDTTYTQAVKNWLLSVRELRPSTIRTFFCYFDKRSKEEIATQKKKGNCSIPVFKVDGASSETERLSERLSQYNQRAFPIVPYWLQSVYEQLPAGLIRKFSRMEYLGYVVDTESGQPSQVSDWQQQECLVDMPVYSDTPVDLLVLFRNSKATNDFLRSKESQMALLNNLFTKDTGTINRNPSLRKLNGLTLYFPDFDFNTLRPRLAALLSRMARDYELWKNAILVALLNTMLFSYYSLAPFLFGQLGWCSRAFGLTGLLLAFASLSGSLLNQRLLTTGLTPEQLVRYACALAALSGLVAWCLQHSAWILIPVFGVVIAYGIAIPNVLSQALRHYREQAGAAGALFGLSYYLLLGMMLGFAGMVQQLGLVLSVCALLAWLCSLGRR